MFQKTDLLCHDLYSWKATNGDNSRLIGSPDRDLLNRDEGYEVLAFIRYFMKKYRHTSIADGKKVELMIHLLVPEGIRSRAKIGEWIDENW